MDFRIDVEAGRVELEGRWFTPDELSRHVTELVTQGGVGVGPAGQALDALRRALDSARVFSIRVSQELAAKVEAQAAREGKPAEAVLREVVRKAFEPSNAIAAPSSGAAVGLAAVEPVPLVPRRPAAAVSPATADEAANAIPLRPRRSEPSVIVDHAQVGTPAKSEPKDWFSR